MRNTDSNSPNGSSRHLLSFIFIFVCGAAAGLIIQHAKFLPSGIRTALGDPPPVPDPFEADQPGRWAAQRQTGHNEADLKNAVEKLEAIGYVSGHYDAPADSGVTINIADKVSPGINLCTSAHSPCAYLMDSKGTILHQWTFAYEDITPDDGWDTTDNLSSEYWRRVYMYDNGDLLAIYEGIGMIKLDKRSNLLWAYPGKCHHDIFVAKDGTIYTLTRKAHIIERLNPDQPILEDFITTISPDGVPQRHVSVLECIENSMYAPVLSMRKQWGDLFHTNTVELLDGTYADRSPIFAAGNILVSLRELNLVAIIDPANKTTLHAISGLWVKQHDPILIDDARMLVFDNRGNNNRSQVIELDPLTQEVYWTFGRKQSEDLHSGTCGTVQRLSNGDTLITETDNGRAIEVTRQGEIVWEYINPERAGENGDLIATLCEVLRLTDPQRYAWLGS